MGMGMVGVMEMTLDNDADNDKRQHGGPLLLGTQDVGVGGVSTV